ncbi:MAG: GNAT family N-acetyltransferase, partial [bacterium]|nr:GNAT family N-acetyltransferase [bacterium]
SSEDIIESYKLRREVFCSELQWVEVEDSDVEFDKYDKNADNLGIFTIDNLLIGSVRLVRSIFPIMIEDEFADLISSEHNLRKSSDTVEVSRLAIKKEFRSEKYSIMHLMHNWIYQWMKYNKVKYSYAVVEEDHYKSLEDNGFKCVRIGDIKSYEMCKAMGCFLDWSDFYNHYPNYIEFDKIDPSLTDYRTDDKNYFFANV